MHMKKRCKLFLGSIILLFALLSSSNVVAQETKVTGTVTDSNNEPLIGVSVMVEGTNNGTTTNLDGFYSIKADSKSILVFNMVGLLKQKLQVGTQKTINVVLKEDNKLLDEVVVVGYGVQKKSVVTGAIASVSADALAKIPPTRIENVLKGQTSGVTITQSSGQPGDGSRVRIRGIGTINNSDPLYIVDGMPIGGGIDYLNPTDIKSVEVLKDAASAAVYGSRAANGVILITTKSGNNNSKAVISYDYSLGYQNPWKKRSMLNASEYAMIINEMQLNAGKSVKYPNAATLGVGTDWQNELFNYNAPMTNHQVSISGGGKSDQYFLSFGYFSQDGVVGGNYNRSNYDRWNVRLNNTHTVFDESTKRELLQTLKVGTNIAYSHIVSTGLSTNDNFGSPIGQALLMSPLIPVYAQDQAATLAQYPLAVTNKDGLVFSIPGDDFNEIVNPVASMYLPASVNHSDKFVVNAWAELQLIKNLKFKSSFGTDIAFWGDDGWQKPYYLGKSTKVDVSKAWSSKNQGFDWQLENILSYQNTFFEKHSVMVLLGQSAKKYIGSRVGASNIDLIDYDPYKANLGSTTGTLADQSGWGGRSDDSRLASYFGRVNYNYNEKYMAEVTIRRDASSNFGVNHRWATFPAFSTGWAVTQEEFMANRPKWFDSMKVRASWGKNGNQSIGSFGYTTLMWNGNNYTFGSGANASEVIINGAKPSGLPNPDLRWEESIQTNFGIDTRFLNGALTFTVDYYKKVTDGMLMQIPLPSYVGDSPPTGNVGIMENSGVEFDISHKFKIRKINVNLSANASYLNNVLVKLGNESGWANYDQLQSAGTISRAENGEPFPYFYGYKTNGIFQSVQEVNDYVNGNGVILQPNAKPGDVRFVDFDENGVINDEDRTKIGKGMPDWTYGFTINLDAYGFDLSTNFIGTIGNDIFDATRRIDLSGVNMPAYMLNRWTGSGSSNYIPRVLSNSDDTNGNWKSSDLYIQKGDFLRLKNMQIGYTVPKSITKKVGIQSFRIYLAGENLATFTSYRGFEPEISSGGTSLGIDRGVYPQSKTVSVGLNLNF